MEFRKYSSITNTYNTKFVEQIQQTVKPETKFACFEKLHGANFQFQLSIVEDNLEIKYGRRTGILQKDENFMDYERHLATPEFTFKMTTVWNKLKSEDTKQIIVYGEYFGGRYPHSDFDPDSNKPVQKDIWYSQKRLFCGFDIIVNGQYIDVEKANEVFKECGIFCLQPIQTGTLDELMEFDVETLYTTIPEQFGLPRIENNFAEGIIIRPLTEMRTYRDNRVILKKKRSKYSEKKTVKNHTIKTKEPISEKVMRLINELESYITLPRLENLVSKEGHLQDERRVMKYAGLYSQDIFKEYEENTGHRLNTMETSERKVVSTTINKFSCDFIRDHMDLVLGTNETSEE